MAKGKYHRWLEPEETIRELKKEIEYEFIGNEKEFEDNTTENIEAICNGLLLPPIKAIGRQKMISIDNFYIKPDIMVRHIDGTMTVFEVKKINSKYPSTGTTNQMGGIGQLLLYKTVLESIIKAPVRIALIDNEIFYRTYCAFLQCKLPIALIEFQRDRIFIPYNGWEVLQC